MEGEQVEVTMHRSRCQARARWATRTRWRRFATRARRLSVRMGLVASATAGCADSAPAPSWLGSYPSESFAHGLPLTHPAPDYREGFRSDSLSTPELLGDSSAFSRISALRVFGRRLLVTDAGSPEHLVVVDRVSGAVESRFGRHGEGPGEFRDPRWTHHHASDASLAWVYDYTLRRLALVRLDGSVRERLVRTLRLDQGPYLSEPVLLGDRFVSNGYFVSHTLTVADTQWSSLTHLAGESLTIATDADPMFRTRLNRTRTAVDPAHSRLVLVFQSANRIDIFDSALRHRGSISGPRDTRVALRTIETPRGPTTRWSDENELAYVGVDATNEFIFALFCGHCGARALPRRVHVFTWEGRFVSELNLDRSVETIAVSADGRTLYGSIDEPYPAIAAWRVPVESMRPP